MSNTDQFEDELEELCAEYLDIDDVTKDDLTESLTAVKHRLAWKRDYPED